ncbi:MAG: DEAD/DEAH box helicase [Phycisphaeraceae bacterium]|nr:MAG: DEAD/DEAH box helicase [Phycisphaeraceae bacterium]
MTFASLNLAGPLLASLAQEGYETPTPVQAGTIPPALEGRDILGCAQTGTGKTAAFALPILHRLMRDPMDKSRRGRPPARALVLSPTRELATQIAESFRVYGRGSGITGTVIFGGVGQGSQVRALRAGVDVIVATPGRLLDLMEQGHVDLSGITMFVLDEADRMLDMGFIKPIREIAAALPPEGRQTLLFSATMPKEIRGLAESLLRDPVRVTVTPVSTTALKIEQKLFWVPRQDKFDLLSHLLGSEDATRVVVFCKTKHGSDKVCRKLTQTGVSATAIHGNKAQNQRDRALDAFRAGRVKVLVATDVAARGLDVDGISHVFNYDLPMEPEAYVHRIGRTGRAGASGVAISFCDHEERDLLRQIERLTGKKVPTAPIPDGIVRQVLPPSPESSYDTERSGGRPPRGPRPERSHREPRHNGSSTHAHPLHAPASPQPAPARGERRGRDGEGSRGKASAARPQGAAKPFVHPKDKGKPKWASLGKGKVTRR